MLPLVISNSNIMIESVMSTLQAIKAVPKMTKNV